MISCITDHLSDRPQVVPAEQHRSTTWNRALPLPLHAVHHRLSSDLCHLQKCSGGKVHQGWTGRGSGTWSDAGRIICSSKTKAMVVDYRRKRTTTGSITLMGQDVEQVDPYSYLGVYLDNKLGWKVDSEAV